MRRLNLRLATLAAAIGLALAMLLSPTPARAGEQIQWKWCKKCQGLFFSGNSSQGNCALDHAAHDSSLSGEYCLDQQPSSNPGQSGWRWCRKCQALYFGGSTFQGVCPAGGAHDGTASGLYSLDYEERAGVQPHSQRGWRWCPKCQSLVFAGNSSQGACPAGATHTPSGAHYLVKFANPFTVAGGSGGARLLVIAPKAFAAAVQPLIDHKNRIGMSAVFVSRENLTAYFTGADDPERIKRGIYYAYQSLGTRYVMLVGDASQIPARFRAVELVSSDPTYKYIDGTYNPSDLYYADLKRNFSGDFSFDNWDANGNGKYNEQHWADDPYSWNPDGVEGYPEVAVGRVPAHTAEDVTHYVRKVIRYETGQMSAGMNGVTYFFDRNYPGSNDICAQIESDSGIGSAIPASRTRYLGLNYGFFDALPSGATFGTFNNVPTALTQSIWATYVGHGYNVGWAAALQDDTYALNTQFDYQFVSSLTNQYALPVVFSASCETGQFAPQAPFGEYRDTAGKEHWFWWNDPSTQGHVVADLDTNLYYDGQVRVPAPNPYDLPTTHNGSTANRTFAYSWLCSPQEGGAIAYFGETSVCPNNLGAELETRTLAQYKIGYRVLGDLWLGGQRTYWSNNQYSQNVLGAPRVYLGIMTLFGDPSLRLR